MLKCTEDVGCVREEMTGCSVTVVVCSYGKDA